MIFILVIVNTIHFRLVTFGSANSVCKILWQRERIIWNTLYSYLAQANPPFISFTTTMYVPVSFFIVPVFFSSHFFLDINIPFAGKAFKQSLNNGVVAKLSAYDVIMRAAEIVSSPNANDVDLCDPDETQEKVQEVQHQ